jgi:hypothetical protein
LDVSVSPDGLLMCTTSEDKALKVFDVINFGELMKAAPLSNLHPLVCSCRYDQHVQAPVCSLLLRVAVFWWGSHTCCGMVRGIREPACSDSLPGVWGYGLSVQTPYLVCGGGAMAWCVSLSVQTLLLLCVRCAYCHTHISCLTMCVHTSACCPHPHM